MKNQVNQLATSLINKLNLVTTPAIHDVMSRFPEILAHQWNVTLGSEPRISASLYMSSWELSQTGMDIREIATSASLDAYTAKVQLLNATICGVDIVVSMSVDQCTTPEERQLLRDLGRVVTETNPASSYETVVCGV